MPAEPFVDRKPHFSTRTKARKGALDVLFEADLLGADPLTTLHAHVMDAGRPVMREYTAELVEGVCRHLTSIDERLGAVLERGWTLDRMPRVDRCLARIAVFEMDHGGIDARVAIAEALVLAGELSTDDSPSFLNGVLSAVAKVPLMDETAVEQVHADETGDEQVELDEVDATER